MADLYGKPITWFAEGYGEKSKRGVAVVDLGARMLADAAGRKMIEAWLAINDPGERAIVLQTAQTLAGRTPRHLQAAE